MSFLSELKRRRVGKVAIAYGAVALGVTEACSNVFPALKMPDWTMTFVVVFLLVGFPVAMTLAWVFDVGPQGIQRTEQLSETPTSVRTQLRAAYALLVIIAMGGLGYVLYERGVGRAHAGSKHSSIAVLPFTNLSGDPAKDYFSDGMSEELLNLLARVPGLQVASRTSAFAYKNRNVDIREVGDDLGVETVLEGSVRQAGEQVRITAQLIDTETGFHLWSETYDRKLSDIFKVQDEIAGAIVDKLRIELAPKDQQLAQHAKPPTQDVEAYELYLQGRAIWKRRGEQNLRRALELYQGAVARDPAFARAHAAIASAYVVLPGYTEADDDQEELFKLAESSARQALTLDPNIGEAHAVLAQINAERGDLLDAESGFFFAISLEPNEATPHHWYSLLLARVGRMQAALEQAQKAQTLDPTSAVIASNLAGAYLQLARYDEASRYTQMARDLGLDKDKTSGLDAEIAMHKGEWEQAKQLLVAQAALPPEIKPFIGPYVDAVRDPARRPAAIAEMRGMDPKIAKQTDLIGPYLQLGAVDQVYDTLFEALDRNDRSWATEWDFEHVWSEDGRKFRTDPRFARLAQRIGIVDYWKQYGFPDSCQTGQDTVVVCT
jgi:TolB-like protein/tetratricopeptide (TPR) repeat protein